MAILNSIEQKDLLNFIKLINKILPNKELLEEFLNKLQPISHKETRVIGITNTYAAFQYPNGDYYMLKFDESGIESFYSEKSIGSVQRVAISYMDNLTLVSRDETITEIDDQTSLPSYILRRTDKKTYKDNELVYHRTYKTKAYSNLRSYNCSTESREVYVSDDRIAYIRDFSISNDELNIPRVTYSKSCSYNPLPFNTVDNPEPREEPFIYPSNENEFLTSTARIIKGKTK